RIGGSSRATCPRWKHICTTGSSTSAPSRNSPGAGTPDSPCRRRRKRTSPSTTCASRSKNCASTGGRCFAASGGASKNRAVSSPPEQPLGRRVRLAVLLSGSGTTLQNLLDEIAGERLPAEVVVVIASRPGVGGLERARKAGIPTRTVARKSISDASEFNDALH